MKKIKTIQELKRFFKKIIILITHKEKNMTQLKYDGKILQGIINNKEVKVTRHRRPRKSMYDGFTTKCWIYIFRCKSIIS